MTTSRSRWSAIYDRYAKHGLPIWMILVALFIGWVQPAAANTPARQQPACTSVPTRFGRMFSRLPPANWPAADVDLLATKLIAEEETEPTPEGQADDEENNDIDAG